MPFSFFCNWEIRYVECSGDENDDIRVRSLFHTRKDTKAFKLQIKPRRKERQMIYLIILVVAIFLYVFIKKLQKSKEKKVYEHYSCEEGNFIVKGRKNNFVVRKNGNIEFVVKDGQIVASRDLRISRDFVYYGGTADGMAK